MAETENKKPLFKLRPDRKSYYSRKNEKGRGMGITSYV